MIRWTKTAWRGETPLWKVFWIYGVVLPVAFVILLVVIGMVVGVSAGISAGMHAAGGKPDVSGLTNGFANHMVGPLYALAIVRLVYGFWLAVALWRCAFNCGLRLWGYVARLFSILGFLSVAFQVYGLFTLGSNIELFKKGMTIGQECMQQQELAAKQAGVSYSEYEKQHRQDYYSCTCNGEIEAEAAVMKREPKALLAEHPELMQACMDGVERHHAKPDAPKLNIDMTTPEAKACKDTMEATAKASGTANVQGYIDDNQDYLQTCIKFYKDNPAALKP